MVPSLPSDRALRKVQENSRAVLPTPKPSPALRPDNSREPKACAKSDARGLQTRYEAPCAYSEILTCVQRRRARKVECGFPQTSFPGHFSGSLVGHWRKWCVREPGVLRIFLRTGKLGICLVAKANAEARLSRGHRRENSD